MKRQLHIKTPAKINIGLNIVSKREDGFHNLETIFYSIHLYDELFIEESDAFSIKTDNALLNNEKMNTIIKAARLLEENTGIKINASITVKKNIPIGAGMGGGSSDGAAALLAFNNFYSLGLIEEQLEELALKIGSDVPYFIDPKVKFAMSRGEIFRDIDSSVNLPLLIINPGIHISTAWAFSKIKPAIPEKSLSLFTTLTNEILCDNRDYFTNDFEPFVFNEYPEIKEIRDMLYKSGALLSMMTGTGSTVFGFFEDHKDALKAEGHYKEKYFTFLQK